MDPQLGGKRLPADNSQHPPIKRLQINFYNLLGLTLFLIGIYKLYPVNYSETSLRNRCRRSSVEKTDLEFRWCPFDSDSELLDIDCNSLFAGDKQAIKEAKEWDSSCTYTDEYMMDLTSDCAQLKRQFKFWSEVYTIPNETVDYSLAYVLIASGSSTEQVVRLLQSVYNKRNLYCLTYDNRTSYEFKRTLHNLDACYDNIIMPDTFVNIYWAHYSILESAMYCLKALEKSKVPWRYVQILSWNDFPLRTNEELIRIMKIFNGAQDSFLYKVNEYDRTRKYYKKQSDSWRLRKKEVVPEKRNELKNIPPGNLVEYLGTFATTMSREFVNFMFTNPIAVKFYQWLNTSYCAEETFFVTLMHNLHINPPGGFPGSCVYNYLLKPPDPYYLSRYQTWKHDHQCNGKYTSGSCVFGVGDLESLESRPEFVAHKLYLNYQPAIYYCLAQLHFNRTFFPEKYALSNFSVYENRPAVRYQQMIDKENFNC